MSNSRVAYFEVFRAEKQKTCLSGLLRQVVWWLETKISEAVLPSSSGLLFVVKEMNPLH
jgi:hypothetical protein